MTRLIMNKKDKNSTNKLVELTLDTLKKAGLARAKLEKHGINSLTPEEKYLLQLDKGHNYK